MKGKLNQKSMTALLLVLILILEIFMPTITSLAASVESAVVELYFDGELREELKTTTDGSLVYTDTESGYNAYEFNYEATEYDHYTISSIDVTQNCGEGYSCDGNTLNSSTTANSAKFYSVDSLDTQSVVKVYYTLVKTKATAPTLTNTTETYDGNPHTILIGVTNPQESGGEAYFRTSDDLSSWSEWSKTKPSRTEVGTTYVQAYTKGDSFHYDSDETETATLTITEPAQAINPIVTSYEGSYDGASHTIGVSGGYGGTIVYSTDGTNYSTTKPSRTNAGVTNVWIKVEGDETHDDSEPARAIIKIDKKNVSKPSVNNKTYTAYSQTVLSATSNYTVDGDTSAIDAGTYEVRVRLIDPENYQWSDGTNTDLNLTWKINPVSIAVDWGDPKTFTYDGNGHAPDIQTPVNGIVGELVYITRSTERNASEGIYTSTAIISRVENGQAKTTNYKLTNTTMTFKIDAKSITDESIEITLDQDEYTYDGTEKKPGVTVRDTARGVTLTEGTDYVLTYASNVNASSLATAIVTGVNNYTGQNTSAKFTIKKATPTITLSADSEEAVFDVEKTFTATANVPGTLTVTSENTENITITAGNGVEVEAETAADIKYLPMKATDNSTTITIKLTPEDTSNYNEEEVTYTVSKINKADAVNPTLEATIEEYCNNKININTTGGVGGTIYYATSEDNQATWSDWSTELPYRIEVGTTFVKAKIEVDENHNAVPETAAFPIKVTKRTLTVTANEKTKIFGNSDPSFDYVYGNNVEGQIPAFTGELSREAGENVGQYVILQNTLDIIDNGDFKVDNYKLVYTSNNLNIVEKDLSRFSITVQPTVFTYDGTAHEPSITIKDTIKDIVLEKGTDYEVTYSNNVNAGQGTITVTGKNNYSGEIVGHFIIAARNITVTADDKTVTYKDSEATLTYTATNVVDGEELENITLTRETGTDAGTYTITATQSAGSNPNYNITFVDGTYTINPKAVDAKITLSQNTYTYNGEENKPDVTAYDPDDDEEIPAAEYTIKYINNKNAGEATVILVDNENGNYTVTGTKAFTIKKKEAIVKPDNKMRAYGETDPELTYTATGLVEGETLNNINLVREEGNTPNIYEITASANEDDNPNYAITFKQGFFIINPKVTDDIQLSQTEYTYDGTEHKPVAVVKDGDNEVPVDEYTYEYIDNVNAGIGVATVKVHDNDGGNYIVLGYRTFTIKPREVTVTADDKQKTYEEADVELTYTSENVVDGESLQNIKLKREAGENAGRYAIEASQQLTSNPNYDITFVNGTYTINPKDVRNNVKIVISEKEYIYDGTDKKPEIIVYDKNTNKLIDASEYEAVYEDNKNVGTAKVKLLDKDGGNYIVGGEETFTINKKQITIKAENKEKEFGATDPTLTYSVEGLGINEILTNIAVTREEGENVGKYVITATQTEDNPNYEITFENGEFKINPKDLTGKTKIELSKNAYSYDGQEKTPEVTVYDLESEKIIDSNEYNIEYLNNKAVGKATVKITNKANGNYIVDESKTFDILDVSNPTIVGATNNKKYYKPVTLSIQDNNVISKVTDNGKTVKLTNGKYTVKQDNKTHEIIAYDSVGNKRTIKISVFKTYTVTFKANKKVVKKVKNVKYGSKITELPVIPSRAGYTKTKPYWDVNGKLKNITSNVTIKAVYIKDKTTSAYRTSSYKTSTPSRTSTSIATTSTKTNKTTPKKTTIKSAKKQETVETKEVEPIEDIEEKDIEDVNAIEDVNTLEETNTIENTDSLNTSYTLEGNTVEPSITENKYETVTMGDKTTEANEEEDVMKKMIQIVVYIVIALIVLFLILMLLLGKDKNKDKEETVEEDNNENDDVNQPVYTDNQEFDNQDNNEQTNYEENQGFEDQQNFDDQNNNPEI